MENERKSTTIIESQMSMVKELVPFIDNDTLDYLRIIGLFSAPASAHHHGNYIGGLFEHSYLVAKTLMDLTTQNKLDWSRPESPAIIGLFHDICKTDDYVNYGSGWEHRKDAFYKGHGDKSVILLSSIIKLTHEEAACIRYHMGAFTDKEQWKDYTNAIKYYPNVLWTHHADMIASQIKGV